VQPAGHPRPVQAFAPDFPVGSASSLAALTRPDRAAFPARPAGSPLSSSRCGPAFAARFRRCERLMVGLAAAACQNPARRAPSRRPGPGGHRGASALPTGRGWLVAALGPESRGLCHPSCRPCSAEPATGRAARRGPTRAHSRPIARMLAVGAFAPRPAARRAPPPWPPRPAIPRRSQDANFALPFHLVRGPHPAAPPPDPGARCAHKIPCIDLNITPRDGRHLLPPFCVARLTLSKAGAKPMKYEVGESEA